MVTVMQIKCHIWYILYNCRQTLPKTFRQKPLMFKQHLINHTYYTHIILKSQADIPSALVDLRPLVGEHLVLLRLEPQVVVLRQYLVCEVLVLVEPKVQFETLCRDVCLCVWMCLFGFLWYIFLCVWMYDCVDVWMCVDMSVFLFVWMCVGTCNCFW